MSYETAPQTKMLATHCAICARPLCDAKSVEVGIGPECREKHGYGDVAGLTEEVRIEANKLIYRVAMNQHDNNEIVAACEQLFALGLTRVVLAVMKRVAKVQIWTTDDQHPHGAGRLAVKTPYSVEAVAVLRLVPGRRFNDSKPKHNTFPAASRVQLFQALRSLFPGTAAMGPKGPFVIERAQTEAA